MFIRARRLFLLVLLTGLLAEHGSPGNTNSTPRHPLSLYPVQVEAGWNLLSLPVQVVDGKKEDIYPAAVTPAFGYEDAYVVKETLEAGTGYWMKFASPQTIYVDGDSVFDAAIPLRTGWNMIGSLSVPMPLANIYTEPAGIISSSYFGYASAGGYREADTLQPGMGYWVKATQEGMLYLTAPGGPEGAITDAERSAILDSIDAFINGLPHTDDLSDNLALVGFLRSIPQFEAADTLVSGVWARFTDGRLFMRANDMHLTDSAAGAPTKALPGLREKDDIESPADNLPSSSTAWICNALGSYFESMQGGGVTQTVNQLRQYHQMAGYTLSPNGGASVGDLKSVSNVGVFYISAHGTGCYDKDGNLLYGVWTSTVQDIYYDVVFRKDLNAGNLVYFSAPDLDDGSYGGYERTHYAITENFVRKYMRFQSGAVVFMNSCWSYYKHEFAQACLDKGAGFYVGWTRSVNGRIALRAARHFFDRMLGTNQYFPENPPQRPFDADLVWNDLILRGYDTSSTPGGPAKFTIVPTIPRTNLLAPSILQAYPSFIPGESKFYIDGLFGQDPRPDVSVQVGGTTLTIQDWDSTKLTLDQPPQGGNVQVTIRGRKSNVTQYTAWHAVFDYTLHGRGSLTQHVVMNVDFLADVHSFRINIANPPIFPFSRYIQLLNTSHATFECSGEYRNPDDTTLVEEWWTGSGSVPLGDGSPGFGFSTTLGPPAQGEFANLYFSSQYLVNNNPTSLSLPSDVTGFLLTMSPAYVIGGGDLTGSNSTGSYELVWGDVMPVFPPDPNGAR